VPCAPVFSDMSISKRRDDMKSVDPLRDLSNDTSIPPEPRGEPLLVVRDIVKTFPVRRSSWHDRRPALVHAISGISFDIDRNETLSLVGESGCGKSTAARCVLRIVEPTSGSVRFDTVELSELPSEELRKMRRRFQMVFQDPHSSLNPQMSVGEIVGEPLVVHGLDHGDTTHRVAELLELVQLGEAAANRYPHQFSGGQRQRIGIARALALRPDLIALDEPVSALDVSIQAEIIRLLQRLRDELGLAYLFIAHDLSVVRHLSDRVAVMYLGKIVETGPTKYLYTSPLHPYTAALLSAAPIPDPLIERDREKIILIGDPPNPLDPPSGCRFRTRCWKAQDICAQIEPTLTDSGNNQQVACHFPLR
jgi:oligopeptide/dipeptide ABC transporter ATP-binding protein